MMKRFVSFLLCVLLILSGWMWYERASFPYNEEGRYFDEANMIVYHQQGEELWRLLFMSVVALAVVYLFSLRILKELRKR
jgi:hypothetical protein